MPDTRSSSDSIRIKADQWLRRLQYVIPRAAYLDLQAAINELAYYVDLHKTRWANVYAQKEGTEHADH